MCIKFLAPKTTNNKPTKQNISDSQLMTSIAMVEKKFKDIEKQIQSKIHCRI